MDHDVARMGICVEKAVVHHLFDEVVYEFTADFVQVIAVLQQLLPLLSMGTPSIYSITRTLAVVYSR